MNPKNKQRNGEKAWKSKRGLGHQRGVGNFVRLLTEKDPQFGKKVKRVTPKRREDSWLI